MHLNKVGINSVCETHIKIQSAGVITTSLAASIDDDMNFSISPAVVMTEAYGYAHFTITFKPNAIKVRPTSKASSTLTLLITFIF